MKLEVIECITDNNQKRWCIRSTDMRYYLTDILCLTESRKFACYHVTRSHASNVLKRYQSFKVTK